MLNPFETGTAFILAYCISLYVSADGPFMHIHTGKENIPDNLIHSGSSCNVGAAQQVVLWCLSLISISVLLSSELSFMKKEKKKKHKKILLSLSQIINWTFSPTCTCTCVCHLQALGWCASEVLQKGRRHLEEGLQAASPFTARQEHLNGRGTKASYSQREGPEWWRKSLRVDLDLNLNGRSEVRVEKVQAQSPTITRGAKSWQSSAAETGPPLSWLFCCLRLASLELEGGERRIEAPVAVTTNGTSCCCWSSMPSCSASCRLTAMALSAKNVRSLALLVLMDKITNTKTVNKWITRCKYFRLKCPKECSLL